MVYAIGIDIGGTKIAMAVVDQTGAVIDQKIIKTDITVEPEQVMEQIHSEVSGLIAKHPDKPIKGIGIGAPGPLDSQKGEITCPPNLPLWKDVPIVQLVEGHFEMPVKLENDANAATIAEKWIGAGRDFNHFIYLTVSTGIGAGVVVEGTLLRGQNGNAGDVGHTVVDPSFGTCACGQEGCLEVVASGTAIAKKGSEIMGQTLTTEDVFNLYHDGHPQIVDLIDRVMQRLGAGCVSLINTFDTEAIVIGGGVSKVGAPLFQALQDYVKKYALNPKGRQTKIIPAKLEQNPGVIGAAALMFDV
ncbi:ROK family protein [Lentibacillus saliphilus]|uniref:ROK family protein n=1 Tax=Lentibacillus saliphilus TaxID=2737028 RepID=UPI001C2FA6E3|nr:ROK family protein [Lentibacillus saliphilus]